MAIPVSKVKVGAMMSILLDLFSFPFSESKQEPQQVKFDRYVYWLERKLMATSASELSDLDGFIDLLAEKMIGLKGLSVQCRTTMISYNSGQVNRIHKLYDLVETIQEPVAIGRLFVSGEKEAISSLLPDYDSLKEMIIQNKMKLKSIEEIASSKKAEVVKFKGSKLTTSNRSESKKAVEISLIRAEVKQIMVLLDSLYDELGRKMAILNYYGQIKQLVHFPLQTLSSNLRNLPSLSEAATHRDHELDLLRKAYMVYNTCRRAEVLAVAAKASQEASYIEASVRESTNFLHVLGKEEYLQAISEAFASDPESNTEESSVVTVKRYTSCSTTELLRLCANE